MFLVANAETKTILWRLKRLGASIVMDDFGTGYSSLGYLRDFPFDKIKIDRSFVVSISTDLASRAIVQAVVGLGGTLKMKVVAEGIELPAQFDLVKGLGCNQFQGFAFSRPLPAIEVRALLEAGQMRKIAAQSAQESAEVITPNWQKISAA
jgi:EAL domain-containing protein (putative c-di-GMP-specific phosphodiesterase class I)